MAEDNQQNQDGEQEQLPPFTPPVTNNEGDNKPNSQSSGNDTTKETQTGIYLH